MPFMPKQPEPNVPAGYDPVSGAIWERPWHDPNRGNAANPMQSIFDALSRQATTRKDLGGGRPYTFAGRVGNADQPTSLTEMMTRLPQESPDAEGMGAMVSLAGTGIPLSKLMKLKPGTDLNQILEQMYQRDKQFVAAHSNPGTNELNRDIWMRSRLNDLALSAYRDPARMEVSNLSKLFGSKRGVFVDRPSPTEVIGQYNIRSSSGDIPRMHQLAATLNMADKSGMLSAENLARATAEQGQHFKATPNQSILDQLSDYLEQIRPERK